MSTQLGSKQFRIRATTAPLTLEQLVERTPAVMATHAGSTTIQGHYQHLSTADVLQALLKEGYVITEAAQTAAKREWVALEAKHLVRLRLATNFAPARREVVPEIIVVNSHNASSKLHLYAGLWRMVCSNGLMAGTTIGQFSFYHRPEAVENVKKAALQVSKNLVPAMMEQVKVMHGRTLTAKQQADFAAQAYALRWEEPSKNVQVADLLQARREADAAATMWAVFNRIQENITQGGFAVQGGRAVQGISQVGDIVHINRALWDLAVA